MENCIEGWENNELKYRYVQDTYSRDGTVDKWEEYKGGKVVHMLDSLGYEEKKIWNNGKLLSFENNHGSKISIIYDAFDREIRKEFLSHVEDITYDDSFPFELKPFDFSKRVDIIGKQTVNITRKFLK